jgi:hypothetical protein
MQNFDSRLAFDVLDKAKLPTAVDSAQRSFKRTALRSNEWNHWNDWNYWNRSSLYNVLNGAHCLKPLMVSFVEPLERFERTAVPLELLELLEPLERLEQILFASGITHSARVEKGNKKKFSRNICASC